MNFGPKAFVAFTDAIAAGACTKLSSLYAHENEMGDVGMEALVAQFAAGRLRAVQSSRLLLMYYATSRLLMLILLIPTS